MSDIAEITYTIREATKLAFNRQAELGDAELQDIVEAAARLTAILHRAPRVLGFACDHERCPYDCPEQ